jgi:hypothetical protein
MNESDSYEEIRKVMLQKRTECMPNLIKMENF